MTELDETLDALEQSVARRRRAVLSASVVGPAVVATTSAAVLAWRTRTSDSGFWMELGDGHVLTVLLGAITVGLAIGAVVLEVDFALLGCAGAAVLAAALSVPALGYHNGHGQHVGPAPWFAMGGFLAAAVVAVLWDRDTARRKRSPDGPDLDSRRSAEDRVRGLLERTDRP